MRSSQVCFDLVESKVIRLESKSCEFISLLYATEEEHSPSGQDEVKYPRDGMNALTFTLPSSIGFLSYFHMS